MTTTTHANGKPPRKQLSHQLDRLDRIIDVMADDLPGAVAAASRDGTRDAIRAVLTEVLADPDVLARLRITLLSLSPPPPVSQTSGVATPVLPPVVKLDRFARLKAAVRARYRTVVEEVKAVAVPARALVSRAKERLVAAIAKLAATVTHVTTIARVLSATLPLRRFLAVTAVVSLAVAGTSYLVPHPFAAVLSGLGGAGTAFVVQIGVWVRRTACSLRFAAP